MNAIEKKHYYTDDTSDHATITKDTAVGLLIHHMKLTGSILDDEALKFLASELYDIYVKSLEG